LTFFPYLKPNGTTGTSEDRMTGGQREAYRIPNETASRPTERPQIDLIGESVALGPLDTELLPKYQDWLNHYVDGREYSDEMIGASEEEFELPEEMYDELEDVYFTVYELGSWRAIGGAALTEIDYDEQIAEFSIIIGEPECRGKGYGSESTRLVLDYAFNALGLYNVMLRVYEYNYSARGAFQRAGFREFSRRRDCHFEGARLWDEIYMGCLASDFDSSMGSEVTIPENLNA
jgi:diamine N-acetyltransferase